MTDPSTPTTPDRPPRKIEDLMLVTGLGRDTVRACIRSGELPGYYAHGRYTIPAQAFDDFCRGVWVPQVRPVFTERIVPITPIKKRRVS